MDEISYETTDNPAAGIAAVVDDGLESANVAAVDFGGVRPLACVARSRSGEVLGGALGRTWGACCEIQKVWVAPSHRRHGIGRRLIELFEQEARGRGCNLLYLETFSFQAPGLYQDLGYKVACEFRGFPGGVAKLIMRKDLVQPSSKS
jgi:GNAT superfamily N-acetyltransferase